MFEVNFWLSGHPPNAPEPPEAPAPLDPVTLVPNAPPRAAPFQAIPQNTRLQEAYSYLPATTGSGFAMASGPGVSSPRPLYKVRPEYTEAARAAHLEGTTFLSVVISSEGIVQDIKILRSLDRGLDKKAVEAGPQMAV